MAVRLREAGERLAAARSRAGERKDIAAAIAANGAEDGLLAAARRAGQSIATLSARLAAAAPKISIAYSRGGTGKIRIDGKTVAHGATIHPTRAIAVEIEGVGVITVEPGQSEGATDDAGDIAAQEAQLGELLRRMGAVSLEDAEARAQGRRALQARLAETTAQVQFRAPEGLERLEALHADLAKRAALLGPPPTRTPEELVLRLQELAEAQAGAEEDFEAAVVLRDEARMQEGQLRALTAERSTQMRRLAADLGDASTRKAKLEKLGVTLAAATAARNAAVRDATAWREAAPDETRFAAQKRAAEAAAVAVTAAERELSELRRTEAGIEGELRSDRADDVGSTVAELDEAGAAADERARALAQELDALRLLSRRARQGLG